MKSSSFLRFRRALAAGCCLLFSHVTSAVPVVPGAVGFGTGTTSAGRGNTSTPATVYKVTSLADPGYNQSDLVPGTLRYGIEHSTMVNKARVIVFETSGVIALKRELIVRPGYGNLTIAGQTAPYPGITLRNSGIVLKTGNVLIQHLAIRPGNWETSDSSYRLAPLDNRDCIKVEVDAGGSAENIVIDHVSCSWSTDEGTSSYSTSGPVSNVTFAYSFIGKPVQYGSHSKGRHGYGPIIADNSTNISYIRNLLAFNFERNPLIRSRVNSAQFVNNLIYKPGPYNFNAIYIGSADDAYTDLPLTVSAVGNTIIRNGPFTLHGESYGTSSSTGVLVHAQATSELSLYLSGNRLYNPATSTWYPTSIGSQYSAPFYNDNSHPLTQLSADPHANSGGTTWKAWSYSTLQAKLVALAGKSPAMRDPIDAALFAEVQSGGGDFLDEMDLSSSDPWAPADVVNTRSFTTPANAETDSDGDGYTLLEETLHDYAYKIQGSPRVSVSDTFEDGNFTGWHSDGGSSNFQIATDGSYVLAQLDTSADAQAFLADSAFYEQTVRAKVKPVSFNGSNRFVRVYARYQDPENAYYVALRSTGVIELKKLHYGTVTTLDTVNTLPISVGVWYDVRLEVSPGIPGAPTTLKAVVKNLANSQSVTLQGSDNNPLPPGFARSERISQAHGSMTYS